LKLLGHEWVFSRRRDARLEESLEISRRFSPNVMKWYGATLVIAHNYTGKPGQSRGGLERFRVVPRTDRSLRARLRVRKTAARGGESPCQP
jgi:hypothetical protein